VNRGLNPTVAGELIDHSDAASQGEINRSSQHFVIKEVLDGSSTTGFGSCAATGDEVAWASVSTHACGAGVLAADRRRDGQRGRRVDVRVSAPVGSRWFRQILPRMDGGKSTL